MKSTTKEKTQLNKVDDETLVAQQKIAIYQGQFPHPDILKGFAEVVPDMPERILEMAEKHNKADVRTKNRNSLALVLGQVFTFLITIAGLAFGVVLAKIGMAGASIASIIGGLVPVLVAGIDTFRHKN